MFLVSKFSVIGRVSDLLPRIVAGVFFVAVAGGNVEALSLKEAIGTALRTNPEIGRAIENREAVEFELKQALGLYLPRVDLEASTGTQGLDSPARRAAGINDDPLYPSQAEVVVTYNILDGGFRKSEANRQAARIDSASFRVLERSELIGLEVARLYFEILLQARIVEMSRRNRAFHRKTVGDVKSAISSGQLTDADRQQAVERLAAANASVIEAQQALDVAKIGFRKNVGLNFTKASLPRRVGRKLPKSQGRAIEIALSNNPRVRAAGADLSAAAALVEQAKGARGLKLLLEGRASVGDDINSIEGYSTNLQGKLILRWNLFDGSIKNSKVQENIRRESEAVYAQQKAGRDVREAVSTSWSRITRQNALASQLGQQLRASNGLVSSYQSQFTVGQRSLLDVLDAQNTRFNVQVLSKTAEYSSRFAEYRLMAATGSLLGYLNLSAPRQADAYGRDMLGTPLEEDTPIRNRKPVNFSAPIDLTDFVNW